MPEKQEKKEIMAKVLLVAECLKDILDQALFEQHVQKEFGKGTKQSKPVATEPDSAQKLGQEIGQLLASWHREQQDRYRKL